MRPAAPGAQAHLHLRHPRSGRGDDARRPYRRHARRRDRAGRNADGNLFQPGQLFCRRFLRLAVDEPARRRDRAHGRDRAISRRGLRARLARPLQGGRSGGCHARHPAGARRRHARRQRRHRASSPAGRAARQRHAALFRCRDRTGIRRSQRRPRYGRRQGRRAHGAFLGPAPALPVRRRWKASGAAVTTRRCLVTTNVEERMDYREKSEIRDGMQIDWDRPIAMDDGLVLRCDIYRPIADGKYPVIMTYGPYGKWLHFADLYKDQWERMCADQPDVPTGSTNKYQNWEVVDPEKWVPDGYVCIRVDSRGAGRSPGTLCHNGPRETHDIHLCIEWAAVQPWCTGKVGMNGISYYASNQWRAAATQPSHLAAICAWEGWNDAYRDGARHGGILFLF